MTPDLDNLTADQKRELLAQMLRQRARAEARGPLSYNQKSMWYLYCLAPDSPAYNARLTAKLRHTVDAEQLKQACDFLIGRHEILRTTYGIAEGESFQEVRV